MEGGRRGMGRGGGEGKSTREPFLKQTMAVNGG